MDPAVLGMVPIAAAMLATAAAPFIQEDAAVLGAAALAVADPARAPLWLAACLGGLIFSDLWKYGLGAIAHRSPQLARFAAKPRVAAARNEVVRRLGIALIAARFIPGTRIPLYLAAGYARAPFDKFAAFVALSAAAYVGLAYRATRVLGSSAFEPLRLPAAIIASIALGAVLIIYAARWRTA
jgi:membrane protein DedA with SNARE-associated domain